MLRVPFISVAVLIGSLGIAGAQQSEDLERIAFDAYPLATLSVAAETKSDLPQFKNLGDAAKVLGMGNAQRLGSEIVGFDAQIYEEKSSGKHFLVFRGSDGAPLSSRDANADWIQNIQERFGMPTIQHNVISPWIARQTKERFPDAVCVGHSLGGANATVGCGPIGLKTVTFNPAGLNWENARLAEKANSENIKFSWDFASSPPSKLVGKTVQLPAPSLNPIKNHSIATMASKLQELGVRFERRMLEKSTDPEKKETIECGSMEWYAKVGTSECGETAEDTLGPPKDWRLSFSSIAGHEAFPEDQCMTFQDSALGFGKEFASLFYAEMCTVAEASGDNDFAEVLLKCDEGSRSLKIEKDGSGFMKVNEIEKERGGKRHEYSRKFTECR